MMERKNEPKCGFIVNGILCDEHRDFLVHKPHAEETCNGVTPPHDECAGGECSRTPAPTGEGMNPGELGTPVRFEIETADGWIVRFEGDDAARHVEALDAACALATLHGAAFPTALPTIGRKLVACLTCGGDGRTVLGKPCPDCARRTAPAPSPDLREVAEVADEIDGAGLLCSHEGCGVNSTCTPWDEQMGRLRAILTRRFGRKG